MGNPSRKLIHSEGEFIKYVDENNGKRDVYTSVYPLTGEIDKIFWDLDGKGALQDAKVLYTHLKKQGFVVVVVVSGKKGFHLYLLLKPKKYESAKALLTAVTYSILAEAFKGRTEVSVDPHPIGDVRRICRVPNTLRPPENLNYCTYLPEDFLDWNEEQVAIHMKSPHVYDWDFRGKYPTLNDFEIAGQVKIDSFKPVGNQTPMLPDDGNEFLKRILRPCLYRNILVSEPRHDVRVATTVDMLDAGLNSETIFNAFSKLGWADWDAKITRYQIEHCRYLKPFSNRRLREKGIV